jgi:hypothetical protein
MTLPDVISGELSCDRGRGKDVWPSACFHEGTREDEALAAVAVAKNLRRVQKPSFICSPGLTFR